MTAEQLQAARAAHWRQQQNPILTLDDAARWIEQHPLCLYLPRRGQLPAPAPSFVEACLGHTEATPGSGAMEPAQALLTRLIESGEVAALNLFGAVGEQPDFLAARAALPYVLCLRADADWKHAPEKSAGHKVSPLVLELWKALDKEGTLTAAAARETLGRELTEAAVLRGLCELWQGLRISPVFAEAGQPARWELLRVRHRDALSTAAATSQVTALSLLVSIYLQSVYAATGEEIEIFLSPLASRSRVREAVRGLSATRQIHSLSMEAQTYYFLEGGLPEFAQQSTPIEAPLPELPRIAAPRRPSPATRPTRSVAQEIRPAGETREEVREGKKPRRPDRPAAARPSFPSTRSFPPAPGPSAGETTPSPRRADSAPHRGARPGARPEPQRGPRTKPAAVKPGTAGPAAARDGKKPRWPGKPGGARPTSPSSRSLPPASGQGAVKTSRAGQRTESPRGGVRPERRPGSGSTGQRPAPWARSGAKSGSAPPFRSSPGPRPDRASGQQRDGERTPGLGSGRPPGASPASGRPPASFRSKPGRSGGWSPRSGPPGSRPPRNGETVRPPFAPASRPVQSWPRPGTSSGAKPGRPGGPIGPPRSGGPPGGRPPRPGAPRDGEARSFAPSSRPAKSWSRTGTSPGRPSGPPGRNAPGRNAAGRNAAGRAGGKPGGKPGRPPANFRGRKPARKKPGV